MKLIEADGAARVAGLVLSWLLMSLGGWGLVHLLSGGVAF